VIRPFSSRITRSASASTWGWCDTTSVVFPFLSSRRDARTVRSVSASSAEVNSSRIRIGAFRRNARAMEIRCRWPTESVASRFWSPPHRGKYYSVSVIP
jgi:hypothetical protein